MANPKKKAEPQTDADPEKQYQIRQLQTRLSSHFGTRVHIKSSGKEKGEIKIPYVSSDDLNRILELLDLV